MTTKQHIDEDELHWILHSFREFSPLYGDRLANHLPMAVTALWRMGGDAGQIRRFAQNYAQKLERRPKPAAAANSASRVPQCGSHDFEQDSAYFAAQLAASGADAVLGQWIPRLLPGLSASAFHCLIRTAYAVESGYISEIADALAFWSSEYTDFAMPWVEQDRSPQDVIGDMVACFGDGRDYSGIIIDKMIAVSQEPFFAHGLALPRQLTLDRIRAAVLDLYSLCDDFALLHTVTATHAMRVLHRFVGDQDTACRFLWQGLLLAVATVANVVVRHPQTKATGSAKAEWDEILSRSRESLDDHVIKLVYTAREESRLGDGEQYRWIAARKVGMTTMSAGQAGSFDL